MFMCWSQPYMHTNFHNQSLTKDNAWSHPVRTSHSRLTLVSDHSAQQQRCSHGDCEESRTYLSRWRICRWCFLSRPGPTWAWPPAARSAPSACSLAAATPAPAPGQRHCVHSGMGYCGTILQWNGSLWYYFTVEWVTVILFYSGMG